MKEVEKEVHVVHGLDTLVYGVHNDGCVFGQFKGLCLLVPRPQLAKLREQRDQLRVILEQPGKRKPLLADGFLSDLKQTYQRRGGSLCCFVIKGDETGGVGWMRISGRQSTPKGIPT